LCDALDVPVHRGSEHDVLSRYHEAALKCDAEVVVRMTSDCPVIDPQVSDMLVRRFLEHAPALDYATNGIPRSWPVGLDTEVMRMEALDIAAREADDPYDREHVSPFLYRQPNRFRILSVVSDTDLSHHRWTLDERGDYELLRRIIEALYPDNPTFGHRDIIGLLADHPDWSELNAAANQKPRRWETHTFTGALADRPLETLT
jgi:spore coat polysaccharide biosynthesis protein SpsF